ncbi:MAG TPA: patatin-like phospholipase family protein, partial [Myxococcaceae bacterium]|nr:patatin-like phospholipase family protein [Myxococcaceae bacterium]
MRRLLLLSILLLCSACKTTGTPPPGSLCAALHPAALTPLPEEACPASRDYPFTNLVFEGGGVKGVAYGGALEVLERQGILSRIERVAGTSAGSIAALLVALRYSPQEIRSELMHLDFKQFEDDGGLPGVFRIFNRYGYFKGDFALDWLRCRVAAKAGNPRATFRELHEKGFRELTVVVTDLSRRKSVLLSYATTPDMEVALAARMSMSIPFFFASVRGEGNAVFVDGGVFMNYPLSI